MKQWDPWLVRLRCVFLRINSLFFLPPFVAVVCVFASRETSVALCWNEAKLTHLLPYYFPITSSRYAPNNTVILRWIVPFNYATLLFSSVRVFRLPWNLLPLFCPSSPC